MPKVAQFFKGQSPRMVNFTFFKRAHARKVALKEQKGMKFGWGYEDPPCI